VHGLDLLVLARDGPALRAVDRLPSPALLAHLWSRESARAALLKALVVGMAPAPSAAYMDYLVVLSE